MTYEQAKKVKDGLIHLGFAVGRIWALIGNSPGLDAYKYDEDDPIYTDADGEADGFAATEDRQYSIELVKGKENDAPGASVDLGRIRHKFGSRNDGLSDFFSTAAEVPLAGNQNAFNAILNWPEVQAGWNARLNAARDKMGV